MIYFLSAACSEQKAIFVKKSVYSANNTYINNVNFFSIIVILKFNLCTIN